MRRASTRSSRRLKLVRSAKAKQHEFVCIEKWTYVTVAIAVREAYSRRSMKLSVVPSAKKSLLVASSFALLASACGGSDEAAVSEQAVVDHYAVGVHASYEASLASATLLDVAVDGFIADPTDATLAAAKSAWLEARDDYGPTEAFRFYDGPIDNADDGPEGQLNAWPMDENYVDYVEGDTESGIINDPEGFPAITVDVLTGANEAGGESNISTGWHAIEFLLWGQDLNADGPGERPVEDYTTNANADRRGEYLAVVSDLLISDLEYMVTAWAPDADNYRKEFVALDANEALRRIITGAGELSRGELGGERMAVAFEARSQEDEHSCFSDNTTADIVGNAKGVEMVLTGDFPGVSGPSVIDLISAQDSELGESLVAALATTKADAGAITAPFDQHLVEGVSDEDPGRVQIASTISALGTQTDLIVDGATALGVTIEVS